MKIGSLNVCGLKSRLEYPDFVNYFTTYDILCFQETKLDKFDIVSLPGFAAISQPRKERQFRKSGGLAVLIKDDISELCSHLETESDYILWLSIDKKITKTDENVVLGVIYVPPAQSRFYNEDEIAVLESEIMSMCSKYKHVFINGDINGRSSRLCDYTALDNFLSDMFEFDENTSRFFDKTEILENLRVPLERSSRDPKTNSTGYWLIETCKNNNLFIVNGRFGKDRGIGATTFRDKSLIDYTLCTAESFEIMNDFEVKILDPIFSDGHALLTWSINCNTQPIFDKDNTDSFPRNFKWSKNAETDFCHSIDLNQLKSLHDQLDNIQKSHIQAPNIKQSINQITDVIADTFMQAASKSLKQTKRPFKNRPFDKPWFGPACKLARKRYHRARKIYNKTNSVQAKNNLMTESKLYKQTMHKYIRKHKQDKISKLRNMQTKDPKEYWKYIKSLQPRANKKQPSLADFYEYFKTINESDDTEDTPTIENLENTDSILNKNITSDEIRKCINNLKNGKAPAEDKILNEYIKSSKELFLPIYEKLFNLVFNTGIMPNSWLEGTIRPIYKNKGDPKQVNNYRPITILSCLGKLFTSVLNSRLTKFLDNNQTILENQAGFRGGYSTTDHIFVLNSLIEILKSQKQKLFCAFVDFSQAFDSVWRVGLWHKLLFNSVDGKFYRIVSNMYKNIKSCIKINNAASAFFASDCGVRQGENLSPMLFALYLNDLESFLLSGGVETLDFEIATDDLQLYVKLLLLLYADDTAIISNDEENFQNCLNEFYDYCEMWKLNVNYNKTEIVIFHSRNNRAFEFKIGNHIIKITDKYKYLGVVFSKSGSFLNARKHVAEQAKKAMHLLRTRAVNLDLPVDLQIKLFDNTVLPILLYGSEIWGYENLEIIERIHTDFLRRISKCRKSTPKYMLYAELGRHPLDILVKQRMVNFWSRLITGKATKLSHKIYLFMLYSDRVNSKWVKHIQNILDNSGRHDIWARQPTSAKLSTGKSIKINLLDQFSQNWNSQLQESSKGRNYNLFKDNTKCEKYVTTLTGSLFVSMIRFRTANHKLPIETGRWNNVDLSERKCHLCDKLDLGDEYHYLLCCTYFKQERKSLIDQYFYKSPNILKFKELLQISDQEKIASLSRFMRIIMQTVQ